MTYEEVLKDERNQPLLEEVDRIGSEYRRFQKVAFARPGEKIPAFNPIFACAEYVLPLTVSEGTKLHLARVTFPREEDVLDTEAR